METSNLIWNQVSLKFKDEINQCYITIEKSHGFSLIGFKTSWLKDSLRRHDDFNSWLDQNGIEDKDFLKLSFSIEQNTAPDKFQLLLGSQEMERFKNKIFVQEFSNFFLDRDYFINPVSYQGDFSLYKKIEENEDSTRFWRLDFKWKKKTERLIFNISSESSLISRERKTNEVGKKIVSEEGLVFRTNEESASKNFEFLPVPIEERLNRRFSYRDRFKKLNSFLKEDLDEFNSDFFELNPDGFLKVNPNYRQQVFRDQNIMVFANNKKAINAVIGMREYGPYKKIESPNSVRLLFIYRNRDEANQLYLKLRNGQKHFPGLLSYVGIPVILDESGESKGLKYSSVEELPSKLEEFLDTEYGADSNSTTVAIVIGPFKKYDSDEEESEVYHEVKRKLLERGVVSQFISESSIRDFNFHYSLPNISIAIMAKLGGIPWKLDSKSKEELIIGFNTKRIKGDEEIYLGSAVFFNNEGKLNKVQGFEKISQEDIIQHLENAIKSYCDEHEESPEKIVIHYYKPANRDEIKNIKRLISDQLDLSVPFALIEINDSKSKLDICFDSGYDMGMPISGTMVSLSPTDYLLFNNNRFIKKPPRRVEDELPIKIKICYAPQSFFSHKELISQVYEFSRLNWKGLKQKSLPVSIVYSKLIAEFQAHFKGEIPDNLVSQNKPWFL